MCLLSRVVIGQRDNKPPGPFPYFLDAYSTGVLSVSFQPSSIEISLGQMQHGDPKSLEVVDELADKETKKKGHSLGEADGCDC